MKEALHVEIVTGGEALRFVRRFVGRYHKTHGVAPPGWRFGVVARRGETVVAVGMVGNALARALKGRWEVTRCCVNLQLSSRQRYGAASAIYDAALREAKRRGAQGIVTYTMVEESGGSVAAAGWTVEADKCGGGFGIVRPAHVVLICKRRLALCNRARLGTSAGGRRRRKCGRRQEVRCER